uniref:MAT1-1-2 n=1 Tax=Ophiognomonia clavigignenti-juglandacearum TaxID=218668 RepID=A0A2P1NR28_9PEZI|nr:MAT1-1-2 [Ophiognomonia clavigignenti-juglandacearum]
MDIPETGSQLRTRLQNNQFLVKQLSDTDDRLVKRVIELLDNASQQDVTQHAEGICEIVENLSGKTGFRPRLQCLTAALFKAADSLDESLTSVLMYLNHMSATGSAFPEPVRQLVEVRMPRHYGARERTIPQSAVRVQKDLGSDLTQKARSLYADAICYPSDPGKRLGGGPSGAHSDPTREVLDGEPQPVGKDSDPRWDPFVRMPGTQHGSSSSFPGPFFAPQKTRTNFDHFLLSQTHSNLVGNTNRKIAHVRANFRRTDRVKPSEDVAVVRANTQSDAMTQSVDFDVFVHEHGNIASAIAPYVENHQVKRGSVATGLL